MSRSLLLLLFEGFRFDIHTHWVGLKGSKSTTSIPFGSQLKSNLFLEEGRFLV